ATSMPVKAVTYILTLHSLSGPMYVGLTSLTKTEGLQNNPTIDITIDDLCARKLVTALTMAAALQHWPLRLRLSATLSKSFSLPTLPPSQPTDDGTPT